MSFTHFKMKSPIQVVFLLIPIFGFSLSSNNFLDLCKHREKYILCSRGEILEDPGSAIPLKEINQPQFDFFATKYKDLEAIQSI